MLLIFLLHLELASKRPVCQHASTVALSYLWSLSWLWESVLSFVLTHSLSSTQQPLFSLLLLVELASLSSAFCNFQQDSNPSWWNPSIQGTHVKLSQWCLGSWGGGGSSPYSSSWVVVGGSLHTNHTFSKIFLTNSLWSSYMHSGKKYLIWSWASKFLCVLLVDLSHNPF